MLHELNKLFVHITKFASVNPVIAGIAGLWGASILTLLFRGIPSSIYRFFERQFTTTLTLNSQDKVYYEFLNWISRNKIHSFVRTLNVNNGRFGGSGHVYSPDANRDTKTQLVFGYGTTFFFFKRSLIFLTRQKESSNSSEFTKESIELTVMGRSQKILQQLLVEVLKKDNDENEYIKIWTWMGDYWELSGKQFKRPLNTIVLNKGVKENLLKHVDNFISERNWYKDNGINYKTGILLMGPPGTGKTSLVKGLASYYNKDLYLMPIGSLSDSSLSKAFSEVSEGAVVTIEDIDGYGVSLNREGKKEEGKSIQTLSISGLLNTIDGVVSPENLILIATTNHPDKLDKALTRTGRFDLRIKIDYMDEDAFRDYMTRFYPKFTLPKKMTLRDKLAPCDIQKLVFDNRNNPEKVLKYALDRAKSTR